MYAHTQHTHKKNEPKQRGGQFANFSPVRHSGSVSPQRRGLHLYSWIMRRGPSRLLGGAARGAANTRNCAQNISLRHVCGAARRNVGRRLSCACARKEAGGAAQYCSFEYITAAKKQRDKKNVCFMLKRMRLAAAAAAAVPPNLGVTLNANSRLSSGTNDIKYLITASVFCASRSETLNTTPFP